MYADLMQRVDPGFKNHFPSTSLSINITKYRSWWGGGHPLCWDLQVYIIWCWLYLTSTSCSFDFGSYRNSDIYVHVQDCLALVGECALLSADGLQSNCFWIRGSETSRDTPYNLHTYMERRLLCIGKRTGNKTAEYHVIGLTRRAQQAVQYISTEVCACKISFLFYNLIIICSRLKSSYWVLLIIGNRVI